MEVFPALALLAAAVVMVTVIDRTAFWLQSSIGGICVSPPDIGKLPLAQEAKETLVFRIVDPCMATGLRLSRHHRYEISMQIPDGVSWKDRWIHADLTGLGNLSPLETLVMSAGVPVRRHLGAPWFVPIARVGQYGSDEHALTSSDVAGGAKLRRILTSVIAPRRDGELFLFVNDAYSGLFPLGWISPETGDWKARHLYANNDGTANVTVRRLTNAAP